MAREKHLNVWFLATIPFVSGNCSKPKIGIFTVTLRLQIYPSAISTYNTAGWRKPSSRPALLCSIGLWSRSQPSMLLAWSLILVGQRSSDCWPIAAWTGISLYQIRKLAQWYPALPFPSKAQKTLTLSYQARAWHLTVQRSSGLEILREASGYVLSF